MDLSRRRLFQSAAVAGAGLGAAGAGLPAHAGAKHAGGHAKGLFQPNWDSLTAGYQAPEWFRDAKFGIWAHWSAQCVPEFGDWYARRMYLQGDEYYDHHLKHYGHPADSGFMQLDHMWKAENWDPEHLIGLYQAAGAKYFVALANHHDNFDNFASSHHAWNSTRVGPMKDIIGAWAKVARARGLRFGVSNHSAHAWHWFQAAYAYDPEGPRKGQRYDAARLTKADGVGQWWEGLDPQELYAGPSIVMPDGLGSIAEANVWHEQNDRQWEERPPANNPAFVRQWGLRCKELIDKYQPDLVYFDDYDIPMGQTGLDVVAHYYNANRAWHGGKLEAVVNAKRLDPFKRFGIVEDVERGGRGAIDSAPWQTDTCIGDWHYKRSLFETNGYKSVGAVVSELCDIVSKNGNLLLSIPLKPDGTHDSLELAFLTGLGEWMNRNGEAIYGSRPWRVFGEGPNNNGGGDFDELSYGAYTGKDIRFTTKAGALNAMVMGKPDGGVVRITSLADGAAVGRGQVERVELVGAGDPLAFRRTGEALEVTLPEPARGALIPVLKIQGAGLTAA
jgi:alpha-L-fucosidase